MEPEQGRDLPCKKLRTMFPAVEGEAEKEDVETSSGDHSYVDPVLATGMELMGPDGDTKRDHIRGHCNISSFDTGPGPSGDRQSSLLARQTDHGINAKSTDSVTNLAEAQSASCFTGMEAWACGSSAQRLGDDRKLDKSNSQAERFSFLTNSAAIAENAYIKNKESEKLSGEKVEGRNDSVHVRTTTKARDSFPMASTSSSQQRVESGGESDGKIIAFDRADFEFDFYGAPTQQEEDGMLIAPPERMADTGFIEMFSNSVMSSVLRPQGLDTPAVSAMCNSTRTNRMVYTGSSSGSDYNTVKLANVPFILDPSYVNSVVSQRNINSLPQTLLVHIFKWLSPYTLLRRVSGVCKYWYNASRDPDLWREINLRNQYRLSDMSLVQLLGFSDRVLKINLTDCRFVTDAGIRRLVLKCQHLQSLKLMRCFDLTDSSFAGMRSWHLGSNLRTLHLDGCCKLSDNTVIEIAEACSYISSLHLNQCTKITDAGVTALSEHCHNLKQLLLDHCGKVTDKGLTDLVLGCPKITYLNIMSCGVTDTGIKMLSKLDDLTNLDVSNIPLMTPSVVEYVSRYCKKLDCINVSLNSVIDDNCVAEVVKNLPRLLRFYCVSCSVTDKGLEKIAQYRPTLEALDVGWCQDVTDQGVRVISHACRKLDYFGLIRCDKVTIETIEELVLKYPTVNYSTFILESRRLLERARREGYQFGL